MKVELIDNMGDDLRVVNAARVSFDKESSYDEDYNFQEDDFGTFISRVLSIKDQNLIRFLAKNGHWTPFSHPQITLRYTVPIFVARQEFKHIVGFTRNEVSRRYVDDEPKFFYPGVWHERPKSASKQGRGEPLNFHTNEELTDSYHILMEQCGKFYEEFLEKGVAPEEARMLLPQSMYTSYYITGSLASFARFFNQRSGKDAQFAIQELAEMVDSIIAPLYPISWKALTS